MRRAPPDFSRQTQAQIAQCFNADREQQSFAQCDHLGRKALLLGLGQKGFGIRWNHHAGDDVDTVFFECCDLRAEILGAVLVATRVIQCEAHVSQWLGKAQCFIAPGVAVTVVREQAADFFIGLDAFPAVGEIADDIFQAPEEMVCPCKAFGWITLATEEPRLPRADGRNARCFVQFTHIAHRVGGLRCAADHHQCDFVFQDQVAGNLGCAVRVGLAVLDHNLNAVFLTRHSDAVFEGLLHLFDGPFVGFTEQCQRSCQRRDKTDFDGVSCPQCGAGDCGSGCGRALDKCSAIQGHACLLL